MFFLFATLFKATSQYTCDLSIDVCGTMVPFNTILAKYVTLLTMCLNLHVDIL